MFTRSLRPALCLVLAMTALLGFAYPLIVTGIARAAFPFQAQGSLLKRNGTSIGSTLIGQSFSDPRYFWGRPSATSPQPYNGVSSGGTNFGPLNPALLEKVKANAKALQDADPGNTQAIPVELVTASASGLDPHISPAGAQYQAGRVARLRSLPLPQVQQLIQEHTSPRLLGLIGERQVNVLELNLALDQVR